MKKLLCGLTLCFAMIIGISGVNAEEKYLMIDYDSIGEQEATDENVHTIELGKTLTMKADFVSAVSKEEKDKGNVTPIENNVRANWESSNTKVATVDSNGKVTIKTFGKFKITGSYTSEGITYKDEIDFEAYKKEIRFEIGYCLKEEKEDNSCGSSANDIYAVGDKLQFTASLTEYINGNTDTGTVVKDNIKAAWKSSDVKVATVDSNGIVTFKTVGKVTITATYNYEGKEYTESIDLEAKDELVEKDNEDNTIVGKQTKSNPPTGIGHIAMFLVIGSIIGGSTIYIKRFSA